MSTEYWNAGYQPCCDDECKGRGKYKLGIHSRHPKGIITRSVHVISSQPVLWP